MPTTIVSHNSLTPDEVPADTTLTRGELAVNLADKKIYSSTDGTDVIQLTNAGQVGDGSTDGQTLRYALDDEAWEATDHIHIDDTGFIGLGGENTQKLELVAIEGGNLKIYHENVNAKVYGVRTGASPLDGDLLMRWTGGALTPNTTEQPGARMNFLADGDWTDISIPTKITFQTAADGGIGTFDRMTIKNNGLVGFGINDPTNFVHIRQSGGVVNNVATGSGNDFVLDSAGNTGMTIFAGSTSDSNIYFGDNEDNIAGRIQFDHNDNHLSLHAGTLEGLSLSPDDQAVILGATVYPPNSGFSVATSGFCFSAKDTLNSTQTEHIQMLNGGVDVGGISTTNTRVYYNTTSDYRLKENYGEVEDALWKIVALTPRTFNYIGTTERATGMIAHELQDVFPEAVGGEKDGEQMQRVDYSTLVPLLVAALQELNEKVDNL
jgi:hypothetical protein